MTTPKKPYGDVTYADPGYQKDGKKRYPIDSEAHVRAAWSYINQSGNAKQYSAQQLASIKGRIKAAAKRFGIQISDTASAGRSEQGMDASERRYTSGLVEVRQIEGRGPRIGGYAAMFDKPSRNLGGFVEVVTRSFFDEARAGGWEGVLCRYNHDDNYLLGTIPNTLSLNIDTSGLRYEVTPPAARADVVELVERGDVKRSSFAFRKTEDDWTTSDQGYPLRSLIAGDLVDVAPVNMPAYAETTAKMRSLEWGLRSLADKVGASIEEVRAAADVNDLRRFLVRTDEPVGGRLLFGPAAIAALQAKRSPLT